jgi:nucleotide-binding universal stress UspA family protein
MNLLVPLDGSAVDEIVLTHTTELARLLHVRLILIYTVSPLIVPESSVYSYQLVDKILDDQCEAGRSYLARLASQLEQEGLLVQAHVQIGNQVQALLKEVMAYRSAMMIVAVDHPTRLQRWAVGSVTDQLLEASDCPLIVLNGDQQTITQGDILPAQHRFRQNHV